MKILYLFLFSISICLSSCMSGCDDDVAPNPGLNFCPPEEIAVPDGWNIKELVIFDIKSDVVQMDFADKNNGWLLDAEGSIWKTYDGGLSFNELSATPCPAACIFAADDQHIFAGLNKSANCPAASLLKSADGGIHWEQLPLEFTQQLDALYFLDTLRGFAKVSSGTPAQSLWRTDDGGLSWQHQTEVTMSSRPVLAMDFINQDTGFLSGEDFIFYLTNNGGKTWVSRMSNLRYQEKLHFLDINTGFGTLIGGTWKTLNGGTNWSSFPTGSVFFHALDDDRFIRLELIQPPCLDSLSQESFYSAQFSTSTDGGTTLQQKGLLRVNFDLKTIYDCPEPGTCFLYFEKRMFKISVK